MASSNLANALQDDYLTCNICYEQYKHPKALPCLHSFCEQCLADFIRTRLASHPDVNPHCPMCRKEFNVPVDGVAGFPDNHMISSLLDTLSRQQNHSRQEDNADVNQEDEDDESDRQSDSADTNNDPPPPYSVSAPSQAPNVPQGAYQSSPQTDQSPPPSYASHNASGIAAPLAPPSRQGTMCPVSQPGQIQQSNQHIDANRGPAQSTHPGSHGLPIVCTCRGHINFKNPTGVTMLPNGDIAVADNGDRRVVLFQSTGEMKSSFKCDGDIYDIASNSKGQLLVAIDKCESAPSAIARLYSQNGSVLNTYGSQYRFEKPHGISLNRVNDQFAITMTETSMVYVFTNKGKLTQRFGSRGLGNNQFFNPEYCAWTSKGNIVVANTGCHNIKVFSNIGEHRITFGSEGSVRGLFRGPMGVCIDYNDNIIVADHKNFRVQQFDSTGKIRHVLIPDTSSSGVGQDLKPKSLCLSHNGEQLAVLLTSDTYSEVRVYQYRRSAGSSKSTTCSVS